MDELPYKPAQEKEHLFAAIGAVYKHWGTAEMAHAYENLLHAVVRVEQALSVLTPGHDSESLTLRVHVLSLGCMSQYARDEIARVECCASTRAEQVIVSPPSTSQRAFLQVKRALFQCQEKSRRASSFGWPTRGWAFRWRR